MSYHPNIPQANDDPSVSQGDMLDNFIKLNSDFSVNHVPFTSGGNRGFHTLVQFPTVQASDPAVSGLESVVYPKAGPTDSELFFRNVNSISQMTNLPVVNGTITNVIPGANGRVTSERHGLATNDMVTIRDVVGITSINGNTFTITVVDLDNFDLNAAVGGAYVSGGTWTEPNTTRFGFDTPWGWIVNTGRLAASIGTNRIQYSIFLPAGFTFYGGFLTPAANLNQFGLITIGNQTFINFTTTAATTFNYLIIASRS